MLSLKYVGEQTDYIINFKTVNEHVIQITGEFPIKEKGFTCSRIGSDDNWDYSGFKTLFQRIDGGAQFSDDGSIYIAPPEPEPIPEPEPYVPTLAEVQEAKVAEMDRTQQAIVQAGFEVVLADETTEHFDLTEKEQKQLAVLQGLIARGDEKIPWHTSDETEHCKYYSNEDMSKVVTAAFNLVTYHETYFRDLRIYIRSMETKEAVEAVTYGMEIPESYRSQPLADMLAGA